MFIARVGLRPCRTPWFATSCLTECVILNWEVSCGDRKSEEGRKSSGEKEECYPLGVIEVTVTRELMITHVRGSGAGGGDA